MSSRLSTKPSRKDRPRSSDKLKAVRKRDGTPEKPVSPNQSQSQTEEEAVAASKQVLDGEEIRALAIDHNELAKIRAPKPPSACRTNQAVSSKVTVRKLKPQAQLAAPTLKQMLIAKPAPPDACLKGQDFEVCAQPSIDASGNIIPHSILGTVEDFKFEARKHDDLKIKMDYVPMRPKTPCVKYRSKNGNIDPKPRDSFLNENNALINWQLKMMERKKQQGYISTLLEKPKSSLVMNKADDYRQTQEQRYLIERSIPALDYGKGYRIGSEFWNQQERIGDDLSGIHMTLNETERGYPPPIEHIGHPITVQQEMGIQFDVSRPSTFVNYPWHQSQYLKERRHQLNAVTQDLDPYKPDLNHLMVIGSSIAVPFTAEEPTVKDLHDVALPQAAKPKEEMSFGSSVTDGRDASVVGPSLLFSNFLANWTGDSHSKKGLVAHGARVTFEVNAGERISSYLDLVNKGSTTIYYDWKKIPKVNPFEGCATPNVQRFYFNTSSGVLLPGESLKFLFVFKSPNAGIFSEMWQLDTRPVLCGGVALQVTLRGVALQEDTNKTQRHQLEQDLFHKQAKMSIKHILDDLVDGITTPQRPCSPIDAYITQEEIFEQNNPGMHYSNEVVSRLNQLYSEKYDGAENTIETWNLSVECMKKEFLTLEDETKREALLKKMNDAVTCLHFPPLSPIQQEMYRVGYQLLLDTVDNIVTQSTIIRENLGMQQKEVETPDTDQILAANENLRGGEIKKKKKEHKEEDTKKEAKKENKKGKKEEKDKDRPKSKGGKTKSRTATSPPPLREPKKGTEKKIQSLPLRSLTPPSETGNPVLDAKYRNKMYIQVYGLLSETIEKMTTLFEEFHFLKTASDKSSMI